MSIVQTIQNSVEAMPMGKIFGYQELPGYARSPSAVIKAIGRMVSDKKLERFSKGKFYVPKKGFLGLRKPSDGELIRSMLYKNGRLRGYVTGLSLYNKLGLTTQIPRTITVACNGGRQEKEFGTIRIKTVVTRIPIEEKDVKLLQYLDVLKDIKKILDSDVNLSLKIMSGYISKLSAREQKRLLKLAMSYYSPQVRALVGLLFSSLKLSLPGSLVLSLNPTTIYKLKLDQSNWPMAKEWNIQ
ncbi:MAG: hypothetical protein KZQ64_01965 [gamma proteobacterium symbiont of Bathyaustriella thionipta]|nr:hypothetical protein [gamma proteobacterium symbiont of Bathyaustriella thionipta]MCU7950844.1 hypothetical protein [gamma proteobacterium symbiont of Bathyaustriella thionipta]MCU7952157.1 hypothetical protein [gamma proteobacterium symbiont of Bathyaustriella thionipta]MCU7957356.1 hypothetical protein [gamma proteobacterium symbiont of Bathyaustriella thionipta]MCU7967275.1 hypothetical protein [gamma proteobacterium symbiont of Bathyaustriella thionipta]